MELFAVFSADPPSNQPQRISMEPGLPAGEIFPIEIHASGIDNLYGAGFTVLYDPTKATFLSCDSEGSILVSKGTPGNPCDDSLVDGAKFSAGLASGVPGILKVRASLDGLVPGLPPGADGLLLTLTFHHL